MAAFPSTALPERMAADTNLTSPLEIIPIAILNDS